MFSESQRLVQTLGYFITFYEIILHAYIISAFHYLGEKKQLIRKPKLFMKELYLPQHLTYLKVFIVGFYHHSPKPEY